RSAGFRPHESRSLSLRRQRYASRHYEESHAHIVLDRDTEREPSAESHLALPPYPITLETTPRSRAGIDVLVDALDAGRRSQSSEDERLGEVLHMPDEVETLSLTFVVEIRLDRDDGRIDGLAQGAVDGIG